MNDSKNLSASFGDLSDTEQAIVDSRIDEFVASLRRGDGVSLDDLVEGLSQIASYHVLREAFLEQRELERQHLDEVLIKAFAAFPSFDKNMVDADQATSGVHESHTSKPLPEHTPKVSNYELIDVLGTGGTARVFLASHYRLRRIVALKCPQVRAGEMSSEQLTKIQHRFQREARIQAQVASLGVPVIHEVDWTLDELPFIAMEPVLGPTFEEKLKGRKIEEIDRENLLHVAQVCRTLAIAHKQGVLHLDLKPQNIRFTTDGVLKVLDWGFGREPGGIELSQTTEQDTEGKLVSQLGGTPYYMSPEQARGEWETLSVKTDSFAVGAIIFEVLTGNRIFPLDTAVNDLISWTSKGEFSDAITNLKQQKLPLELDQLAIECLSLSQENRPDVNVIAEKIETYYEDLDENDRKLREEAVVLKANQLEIEKRLKSEKRLRRTTALAAFGAVLLVSILAVLATSFFHNRQAQFVKENSRIETMEANATKSIDVVYQAINGEDLPQASTALVQTRAFLSHNPPPDLVKKIELAEQDLKLAKSLDKIRQERLLLQVDSLSSSEISRDKYARQLELAGFGISELELADKIASSRITKTLLRAVQDWYLLETESTVRHQLVGVLNRCNIDMEWLELISSGDATELLNLAIDPNTKKPSFDRVELIVNSLPVGDSRSIQMLRNVEAFERENFWVQLALAVNLDRTAGLNLESKRDLQSMAVAHARTAMALNPDSSSAVLEYGMQCQEQHLHEELKTLDQFLDQATEDTWIHQAVLAMSAEAKNNYSIGLEHWDKALQIEPRVRYLVERKVSCLVHLGKHNQALELANQTLIQDPSNQNLILWKSVVLCYQQPTEARNLLAQVLELNPENEMAKLAFSMALVFEGRVFEAVPKFRDTSMGAFTDPNAPAVRTIVAILEGDKESAIRNAELQLAMAENWQASFFLAIAYGQAGRWKEAISSFDRARKTLNKSDANQFSFFDFGSLELAIKSQNIRNVLPLVRDHAENKTADWSSIKNNWFRRMALRGFPAGGDFFLSHDRFVTAAKYYEISTPPGSTMAAFPSLTVMFGTGRISAARAASKASATFDSEFEEINDADRMHFRRLAFKWLEGELQSCRAVASKNGLQGQMTALWEGSSKAHAGLRLSILLLHRDFEPIRNPAFINQMPKEDQERAIKLWNDVELLYEEMFDVEITIND